MTFKGRTEAIHSPKRKLLRFFSKLSWISSTLEQKSSQEFCLELATIPLEQKLVG